MNSTSWARAFSVRRLLLLATAATLGIAAVPAGSALLPALSSAQAADNQDNYGFQRNPDIERFFRRFAMPDVRADDEWWQRDFPQNSEMQQFLRRFGLAADSRTPSTARSWIGVQIQPVTAEIAEGLGMKGSDGALVVEPQADSPAAKAGIVSGDVITAVNGTAIKDARELARKIGGMAPGTTAKLTLWHKGEEKTVELTLAQPPKDRQARTEASDAKPVGSDISEFGMTVAPADQVAGSHSEGLVVTKTDPDGAASEHGIKTGDVILDVGGNKTADVADVRHAISDAQKNGKRAVLVRLRSDEGTRFVALPIARG